MGVASDSTLHQFLATWKHIEVGMLDGMEESELIRQASMDHSLDPNILAQLLELAGRFENLHIYGVKAELAREVQRILDGSLPENGNGGL